MQFTRLTAQLKPDKCSNAVEKNYVDLEVPTPKKSPKTGSATAPWLQF